jgi:hypothetical protein
LTQQLHPVQQAGHVPVWFDLTQSIMHLVINLTQGCLCGFHDQISAQPAEVMVENFQTGYHGYGDLPCETCAKLAGIELQIEAAPGSEGAGGENGAGEAAPTDHYDLWTIHKDKRLLLTDLGGVPVSMVAYVSEDAQKAAEARGAPTISEIGFDSTCHMGFADWESASTAAHAKAKELGYRLDIELYEDFADEEDYTYSDEEDDDYDFDYEEQWDSHHHMDYDDPRHYSDSYYSPAQPFERPPVEDYEAEIEDEDWLDDDDYTRYGSPFYSEPEEFVIETFEDEPAPDIPFAEEDDAEGAESGHDDAF